MDKVETMYQTKRSEFKNNQLVFDLREGSSDLKSVKETWEKNAYQRRSIGFEVEAGEQWLDLGANIGAFTLYALKRGANCIAIEPEPNNIAQIVKNLSMNDMATGIITKAVVPDAFEGELIKFYVNTNPKAFRRHTANANYLNAARKKTSYEIAVPALKFTDLLNQFEGELCLKINIEGSEIPILNDLTPQQVGKIKKMVFEYSFDMDKRIATFRKLLDKMEKLFDTVQLSKSNIPWDAETYDYFPPNCYVFCK